MRPDFIALLGAIGFALLTMPIYARSETRRRPDPLESAARGGFVLGSFVRSWFYWFIRPIERISLALGLSPLFYNIAGAVLGILSGVALAAGAMVWGGWLILAGGSADVLDGRIARALGTASRRGAFLDSTLDRFAEFGVFVGLAVWFRDDPVALTFTVIALGGSLLVSYARARGESVGVLCKVGVLQRAERILLLGFGALFDPSVSAAVGHPGPGYLLRWIVAIVAVGTVSTAIYRIVWIARRLPTHE